MGRMSGSLRLIVGLCSVVLSLGAPQICASPSSCPSSAPYCLMFARNVSAKGLGQPSATFIGVCVQCYHECHCGVNQFCGVDPNPDTMITYQTSLLLTSDMISDPLYAKLVNISKAYEGLPMVSKCLDYPAAGKSCIVPALEQYQSTVSSSDIRTPAPGTLPKEFFDSGQWCGALSPAPSGMSPFAPAFYADSQDTPRPLSTGSSYNTATFCSKAYYQGQVQVAGDCGSVLTLTLAFATTAFPVSLYTPAVAWAGYCAGPRGCGPCRHGDERCGALAPPGIPTAQPAAGYRAPADIYTSVTSLTTVGIPQTCVNGQWRATGEPDDVRLGRYLNDPSLSTALCLLIVCAVASAAAAAFTCLGLAHRLARAAGGPKTPDPAVTLAEARGAV